MDYSKYYTPPLIAEVLIEQLHITPPEMVIDICCGSCNLLYAAKKRWNQIELIGVDIADHSLSDVMFTKMDGREYATIHRREYPLIVANPPFDKLNNKIVRLYQGCFNGLVTDRLEIEMLIANLTMMSENGKLLIIMPNTFVEGERDKKIRKVIGENFQIEHVMRLPDDAFGTAEIKSYALIISHKSKEENTTIHSVITRQYDDKSFLIENTEKIEFDSINSGDWIKERKQINADIEIRRGNISSNFFRDYGTAVLHTSKCSERWRPAIKYVSEIPQKPVYAEEGDIIVSRIGKSAGQWCVYSGERLPITDCLFCMKRPSQDLVNKISGKKFDGRLRGVATRYITKNDFISWACGS